MKAVRFRSDAEVRKVLQEIVSERLGALPSSEQNGSLTVRFQEGRIRKLEWHTFVTVDPTGSGALAS